VRERQSKGHDTAEGRDISFREGQRAVACRYKVPRLRPLANLMVRSRGLRQGPQGFQFLNEW
jgi:hypothetical protein